MHKEYDPTAQTLTKLLDVLLLRYPVDPAQRDLLWRDIARSLGPPYCGQ